MVHSKPISYFSNDAISTVSTTELQGPAKYSTLVATVKEFFM